MTKSITIKYVGASGRTMRRRAEVVGESIEFVGPAEQVCDAQTSSVSTRADPCVGCGQVKISLAEAIKGAPKLLEVMRGEYYCGDCALAQRATTCDACPVNNWGVCDPERTVNHAITGKPTHGCGCLLAAKARDEREACPAGKW